MHATGAVICVNLGNFWHLEDFVAKLNTKLRPHVFLRRAWVVNSAFHPRFGAVARKYRYILTPKLHSSFASSYISEHKIGNLEIFRSSLALFRGKHDFFNFSKRSDAKTSVREIFNITCYECEFLGHECVVVTLIANAFLYAQIRMMIGAALACADSKINLFELQKALIDVKSPRPNFKPASPCGLYLCAISF